MDESGNEGIVARVRAWVVKRPGTSLLLASALTLVVAAAIGIPLLASKNSQVSDLESQVSSAEAERDEAVSAADAIESERDGIIADAEARADSIVGDAQKKANDLDDKIKEAEDELASKQSKLDDVTASLQSAQQTKDMSTFSDGTWAVGEEILPGTYRSTAGGNCYWAILKGPSGGGINNIVENGFGPNATITLSSGQYVEVSGCGEWSPGP